MIDIKELSEECHMIAREHGWWDDEIIISALPGEKDREAMRNNLYCTKILLIHTELSEIVEALRDPKTCSKEEVSEEFADVVIRVVDLCEQMGINLEVALARKVEKNRERPYKHGKVF